MTKEQVEKQRSDSNSGSETEWEEDQEPADDEEELDTIMQSLTPEQREAMTRRMKSINNKHKHLEDEVAEAEARASAQKQIENAGICQAIDRCVKTFLFRTCKFITNDSDLDLATSFVLTKLIGDMKADKWTKQEIANWKATYRSVVSKKLCGRRNYVQQELRKAALQWGKGLGEINTDEDDENEDADDADPTEADPIVPRELFTTEMMLKCATR